MNYEYEENPGQAAVFEPPPNKEEKPVYRYSEFDPLTHQESGNEPQNFRGPTIRYDIYDPQQDTDLKRSVMDDPQNNPMNRPRQTDAPDVMFDY